MPYTPAPRDFPTKLLPYWPIVRTMQTPVQAAWMLYYDRK